MRKKADMMINDHLMKFVFPAASLKWRAFQLTRNKRLISVGVYMWQGEEASTVATSHNTWNHVPSNE